LLIVNERNTYLDQCLELLKFEFDESDDFGTIQLIFCKQLLYNRKDIIKEIKNYKYEMQDIIKITSKYGLEAHNTRRWASISCPSTRKVTSTCFLVRYMF